MEMYLAILRIAIVVLINQVCDRIYQRMQEQAQQFKKLNSFSASVKQ
ncbi:MAG: hypothetical protein ACFCAD_02575 [Pleurocapsa sp.]